MENADISSDDIDRILARVADAAEERVNRASHAITMRRMVDDEEVTIDTTGECNNLLGGYAITVHKAQGSEWRRVFLVLHKSHAVALNRELLYTAVTRAREQLYVICEPNSFEKGVKTQKIKGTTLKEKLEWFKKKRAEEQTRENLFANLAAKKAAREESEDMGE
jgi:ATP-dependent exoDNAse (exonuclease V) alpha subunit